MLAVGLNLSAFIKRCIGKGGNHIGEELAPEFLLLKAGEFLRLLIEGGDAPVFIRDDDSGRHIADDGVSNGLLPGGGLQLCRQIAVLIDAGTNGVLALVDQNALQTQPLGNLVGKGRTDDAVAVRMGEVILQLRFTLIVNGVDGNFREALKYIEIHLPAFAVNRHGDFFRPQLLGPLKAVQIVGHIDVQLDKMLIKPPLELLGIGGAGHKDLTAFADGLVDRLYQCFNGALF